jgi:dTDP-4-dehydrorhamnose reductase
VRILVFGAKGQIGHEVRRANWPPRCAIAASDQDEADITSEDAVEGAVAEAQPDLVINLAAYTAVDRAEGDAATAFAVNRDGAHYIARACRGRNIPLIQLSTDYVFDGRKAAPYREDDRVSPLSVYGCSKEAGEQAVRRTLDRHIILRTSWVFGVHGANFVKTMLRMAAERPVLRVVADQRGRPTAASDIAAALVALAEAIARGDVAWGTYHFAGAGAVTWHEFAEAIVAGAAPRLGARPQIKAITTAEYPTPAHRPANSVLDCGKIEAALGIVPPSWRTALATVLGELLDPAPGS